MLDVGWSEILVIAIVIIVVVGPKDLPKMLRAFGKATARMRKTADEFRRQFDDALREAELDDVKSVVEDARRLDPRTDIRKVFDPIRSAGEELRSSLKRPDLQDTLQESLPIPPPPPEVQAPPPPAEPVPSVAAPAAADVAVAEKPKPPVKKRKPKAKVDGQQA